MKLGEKQELFMELMPHLVLKAQEMGFKVRGGDLFRDPRYHGFVGEIGAAWIMKLLDRLNRIRPKEMYGHKNSCHKLKLAIDLNLFRDGEFLETTKDHRALGEWWKQQHELCRWGGDFPRPDGNHYSLTHDEFA